MLDRRFWKNYFKVYDILNIVIPYKELIEEFTEELGSIEGKLILDAGAGTGNLSIKLKSKGAHVVALDFSAEGLECLKGKDSDIEILQHDLVKPLPFPNNNFDAIVSNNVVYTLEPEKRVSVFKEFYRILKPGGKIIVSNVREGWNPANIYIDHFKKDIRQVGFLNVILKAFKMIIPTIKMFYYNSKIKKNEGSGHLMREYEQKELLKGCGFIEIADNKSIYADQAILNSAKKPLSYENTKGN